MYFKIGVCGINSSEGNLAKPLQIWKAYTLWDDNSTCKNLFHICACTHTLAQEKNSVCNIVYDSKDWKRTLLSGRAQLDPLIGTHRVEYYTTTAVRNWVDTLTECPQGGILHKHEKDCGTCVWDFQIASLNEKDKRKNTGHSTHHVHRKSENEYREMNRSSIVSSCGFHEMLP